MRIAILLNEPYPFGMACTNRIHLYSKGLDKLGHDIKIIIPKPTDSYYSVKNEASIGNYEGINFIYAGGASIRSKKFLLRRVQDSVGYIKTFKYIINFKPDIVFVVSNKIKHTVLGKICAFASMAKMVREKSEVPYFNQKKLSELALKRLMLEYCLYDGLIVISNELKTYFEKDLSFKKKIIEIPILVNRNVGPIPSGKKKAPTFVYTGSSIDQKDGILSIIKAFSIVQKKFPDAILTMTGDINSSPDRQAIIELIKNKGLKNNIELTGYITKQKLNEITFNATALVLAKPYNRQNRYNMATKIGEYLLTGNPIIISNVDPVHNYLVHKESAFITAPDERSIAKEMMYVLNNPQKSLDVGLKGRLVGLSSFEYNVQAQRISHFFKGL